MADVTCPLCDEYYKDPRMLPCLHTFCLQCLEKHISQDTLQCPTCKEKMTLSENGISDLPQDLHQTQEAEVALVNERVENANNELCEMCGRSESNGGKAVGFCIDCGEFLCTFCKDCHCKRQNTREHSIVPAGERFDKANQPGIHSKLIKQTLCPLHTNQPLNIYCNKCEMLICSECKYGNKADHPNHTDHQCLLLDDAARKEIEGLTVHLKRNEKVLVSLDEAIKKCKTTVKQIEAKKKEVDTAINQSLDQIREKLLAQNGKIQLYKVDCLERQEDELRKLHDCVSCASSMIQDVVNSYTPLQQLCTKKMLVERATTLHKRFVGSNIVLRQSDTFTSDIANPDTINQMIDLGLGGSCAAASSCDAGYLPRAAVGKPRKIMVVAKNKEGELYGCGGEKIEVKLILKGSQKPAIEGEVDDRSDGSYSVSIIPKSVGEHELNVTIRDNHVRGSPFKWHVSHIRTTKLSSVQQRIPTKKAPFDVSLTEDGCIVVAEQASHSVTLYSKEGKSIHSFGGGSAGDADGEFDHPMAVAVKGDMLYVVDEGNNRVQKFNIAKKGFESKFGTKGNGNGQFSNPHGICIDPEGKVFIADANNDRIQVFHDDNSFAYCFECNEQPWEMVFDQSGHLHVISNGSNYVQVFTPEGKRFSGYEACADPVGIAIDTEGYIGICDKTGNLFIYSPCHTLVHTPLKQVSSFGMKLACDNEDNFWVTHHCKDEILRY